MVQITRDRDLPLFFEASPIQGWVRTVGAALGAVATATGIVAFVNSVSMVAEIAAVVLIFAGGTLVLALIRCRRYEVTVGERMIELRLGPFRRTLPAGCVDEATARPASAWRRFYAPRELILGLSVETRPLVVPTHDPDELGAALLGREHQKNRPPGEAGGSVDSEFQIPNS
jgi:hypothetical protein